MAFENFPEPEKTNPNQNNGSTTKKNNTKTIVIGALIAALLGTWGYLLYDKNQTSEQFAQKDNAIATTSTQRDQLQKELEDATMRYDMLKSANTKLDSTITAKDAEISEKRSRIQELLNKSNATQSELNEAKRLIASLNSDVADYQNQIEVLQGQKIQLTQEKAVVTSERDVARKNYDSATVVIHKRDSAIDVGSTLFASNFKITPINEKSGGKEKETTTAKRVDKLRISFDLLENMLTNTGTKEVFVKITSPDGKPVAVDALGSGMFSTRDGQTLPFTKKVEVNYTQNQRQNINFDWKQNSSFQTGDYKIEVYNNGFKVGEGKTTLKKGGLFS